MATRSADEQPIGRTLVVIAAAEHGAMPSTHTFWDAPQEEARRLAPDTPLPDHIRP